MLWGHLSFAIADLGSTLIIRLACESLLPSIRLLIAAGAGLVDATCNCLRPELRDLRSVISGCG